MFKKLLAVMAVVVLGMGISYGATSDNFLVTVTPSIVYNVAIATPAAGLTFSGVTVGQQLVAASSASIQNTSTVSADWTISASALDNWTLGATPGNEVASLYAKLKVSPPADQNDFNVQYDTLTTTEANMNASNYTSGGQTGNDVPSNMQKALWVRLDTPTDTAWNTQQRFRVVVTANPASTF